MDIHVGAPGSVGTPRETQAGASGAVEAKVLAVRSPRRRGEDPRHVPVERRADGSRPDPVTGRVLVLMIPDGSRLPEGLESGAFRVFLRFARR